MPCRGSPFCKDAISFLFLEGWVGGWVTSEQQQRSGHGAIGRVEGWVSDLVDIVLAGIR